MSYWDEVAHEDEWTREHLTMPPDPAIWRDLPVSRWAMTEPRDTTTDDTPEPRDDDTGETASDDEAPDAPTTPKEE